MDSNNETMLLDYETRKETDPTFALTLDEFAVLWRAKEKPQECEHGSLKRKCLVCELQDDLQTANQRIKELEKELKGWKDNRSLLSIKSSCPRCGYNK